MLKLTSTIALAYSAILCEEEEHISAFANYTPPAGTVVPAGQFIWQAYLVRAAFPSTTYLSFTQCPGPQCLLASESYCCGLLNTSERKHLRASQFRRTARAMLLERIIAHCGPLC